MALFENEKSFTFFNDINYIPIDYEEIMDLLIERIKEKIPNRWSDFLESNFGMEIIETLAYEASMLAFLMNRNVNECFMPTARTKEAIYRLAKLIGYLPKPPSSATCDIYVRINNNDPTRVNSIVIPKYTKLSSDSGKSFYVSEDIIIAGGENSAYGTATAGMVIKDTFVSNGIVNYPYITTYTNVTNVESVVVDGNVWTKEDFLDILGAEQVYRVDFDNDFRAKIIFGDGKYGLNPMSDSKIEVTYNVSDGLSTNSDIYTINAVSGAIYDSEENLVSVSVTNTTAASGGDSAEDPDEVRRNAPSVFRTQWRAVTKQDFKDLVLAESGVGKVAIMDHTDMSNIGIYGVKIAAIAEDGGYVNNGLKNKINTMLNTRRLLTTDVQLIQPDIVPIDVSLTITKDSNYSTQLIINNIKNSITEYLTWKNRDFDDNVSSMDIYKLVNSVSGVTYADNLIIEEHKYIYVNGSFAKGATTISIIDTIGMLEEGMYITILSKTGTFVHTTRIISIDGSTVTFATPLENNISFGYYVYPVISLITKANQGDKNVAISETPNNISDCIISFSDNLDYEYVVRYRTMAENGLEALSLATILEREIPEGTNIYIIGKDSSPRLANDYVKGAEILTMIYPPRFMLGATLIPEGQDGVEYRVKKIDGNNVYIYPTLITDLPEYTKFKVQSDSINIYKYEIADTGIITINVV